MAVHVEDHPLEYEDFEGVIPAGEYGGGDVIVWDRGTWEPHGTDDPVAAVAAGELHAELHGTRLRGRFVLVRRGEPGPGGQGAVAAAAQARRARRRRLGRRGPPDVGAQRPDQRAGAGRPGPAVAVRPAGRRGVGRPARAGGAGPDRRRARRARRPRAPAGRGRSSAAGCGSRTSTRCCSRPARTAEPVTKRELVRYAARIAPIALPYLRGRAAQHAPVPRGRRAGKGFWHKQLPDHAPAWLPRWDNPEADDGETTTYLVVDEPAALVWAANFGALEWHAWTSADRRSAPADLRAGRHRPGARDRRGTTSCCSRGCTATRSRTSACARSPS